MTGRCWSRGIAPRGRAAGSCSQPLRRQPRTGQGALLDLACSRAPRRRRTRAGAAVTEHALDLASGVGSVRPAGRLRGVLQRLSRYAAPRSLPFWNAPAASSGCGLVQPLEVAHRAATIGTAPSSGFPHGAREAGALPGRSIAARLSSAGPATLRPRRTGLRARTPTTTPTICAPRRDRPRPRPRQANGILAARSGCRDLHVSGHGASLRPPRADQLASLWGGRTARRVGSHPGDCAGAPRSRRLGSHPRTLQVLSRVEQFVAPCRSRTGQSATTLRPRQVRRLGSNHVAIAR
jgi:hypothetical protein